MIHYSKKSKPLFLRVTTLVFTLLRKWRVGMLVLIVIVIVTTFIVAAPPPTPTTDIIVKIGDGAGYLDGDIIHAFNSVRIADVHAYHVVHPKYMQRDARNAIVAGTLLETYLENIMKYKFERTGEKTVRRTNLWTNEVDFLSDVPNAKGEQMDVALYIARRLTLKPNQNNMFGDVGSEYWYGGNKRKTDAAMDIIWDEIESRTSVVRNYNFPFTENETKAYMVLKVDNLTALEATLMSSPELSAEDSEGFEHVIKARKNRVDFTKIGLSQAQLDNLPDRAKSHDFRSRPPVNINSILR